MKGATWADLHERFEFDGGLVDLIAPGTGTAGWEAFWTSLRSGPFSLQAYRDGELLPLPESLAWIMAERQEATVFVSIAVGSITANCHFFGGDLEIDIDPREVTNDSEFQPLITLMRFIADAIKLPVFAMAEGSSLEYAFFQMLPGELACQ